MPRKPRSVDIFKAKQTRMMLYTTGSACTQSGVCNGPSFELYCAAAWQAPKAADSDATVVTGRHTDAAAAWAADGPMMIPKGTNFTPACIQIGCKPGMHADSGQPDSRLDCLSPCCGTCGALTHAVKVDGSSSCALTWETQCQPLSACLHSQPARPACCFPPLAL